MTACDSMPPLPHVDVVSDGTVESKFGPAAGSHAVRATTRIGWWLALV